MSDGIKKVWTPNGVVSLGGPKAERVELRPGLMEWFYQFHEFARVYALGLHCGKCGADLVGKNAETDHVFTASCQCREFVGTNRDWKEPMPAEAFYESVKH